MPFKSQAQAAFMHARKPAGVNLKEWDNKTNFANLKKKISNSPGQKSRQMSPQIKNIVKQTALKRSFQRAKESNLSQRQYTQQKKTAMRQTAIERRQANKK
jgi:hypothetical protein